MTADEAKALENGERVVAPQGPRSEISRLERSALSLLKAIGVQALVIEEIHNILAGTHREQRIVLNALRFLSNELKISPICFGVMYAREAISGDVQLARRFDELTHSRAGRLTPSTKRSSSPSCGICPSASPRF